MSVERTRGTLDDAEIVRALGSVDTRIELHSPSRTSGIRTSPLDVVVIPARNEEERIGTCLRALRSATVKVADDVLVIIVVNDSTDASADRAHAAAHRAGLDALILDLVLPPGAGVGLARAAGCAVALSCCPTLRRLHTSDADAVVEADWLVRANAHLERCDAVCGRVDPIAAEASSLPVSLNTPGALEYRYLQLVLESEARLDPVPLDPWPHHGRASGASLALRRAMYERCGGFAPLPSNEDVDLIRRVQIHDGAIRHADDVRVQASCRLDGRAPDGMADALARRIADADSLADSSFEPARTHLLRVGSRGRVRRALERGEPIVAELERLGVDPSLLATECLRDGFSFGRLWARVETLSPRLARHRLRPSELPVEIATLERALARIQERVRRRVESDRRSRPDSAPRGDARSP